jgi:DNA-binding MarR family transcriptional regulator
LPAAPPTFEQVAATVEQIEGVRFREMFARLPARAFSGDEAIAAVWEMGKQERERREAGREKRERVLASLPPAVRAAFELEGEEFSAALKAALDQLSPDEAQAVLEQLRATDLISGGESAGPDMAQVLREFDSLLRGIAAVAKGDEEPRAQIEAVLPKLEEEGWQLSSPVQRIWAGERDEAALTAGIDPNSAQLVRRILEIVNQLAGRNG